MRSWRLSRSRRGSHLRVVMDEAAVYGSCRRLSAPRRAALAAQPPLQLDEEVQRLQRRQVVGIDLAQVVQDALVVTGEEAELADGGRGGVLGVRQPRPSLAVELGALQVA